MRKNRGGVVLMWALADLLAAPVAFLLSSYESRTGAEWGYDSTAVWVLLGIVAFFLGWHARRRAPWRVENVVGVFLMLVVLILATSYSQGCNRDGCDSNYDLVFGGLTTMLAFSIGFLFGFISGLSTRACIALRRKLATR